MRARPWTYRLLLATAVAGGCVAAGLSVGTFRRPSALSIWDSVAQTIEFTLILVLFYAAPILVLLSLTVDLSPAALPKGDLTLLLTLKRHGDLPGRTGRFRGFRPGRFRPISGVRQSADTGLAIESALEHLVSLNRCGARPARRGRL